jgi:hypothetical protein
VPAAEPLAGAPRSPFDFDSDTTAGHSGLNRLKVAVRAARRPLGTQLTEAEAALVEREAAMSAAQAGLLRLEARNNQLARAIAEHGGRLRRLDDSLPTLETSSVVAQALADRRTTQVAYPFARGRSPQDDADRLWATLSETRRARDQTADRLRADESELELGRTRLEEGRHAVSMMAEDLERRRNALAGLRRQLAAGEPPTSGTWGTGLLAGEAAAGPEPGPLAVGQVPPEYLELYRRHAPSCPGLSWTVLAAIGSIESAHGQSTARGVHGGANFAGAMGPMQFLAETWAAYGVDGNGDGTRDVYNPSDAVAGAANYLCANGGGRLTTLANAIWHYNHADWYVAAVIQLAAAYGGGA